jgi:GNAT superfamily N-acetyltransferase
LSDAGGPAVGPLQGRLAAPPLLDTSMEGFARAIEADTIGTRVTSPELPLEVHLEPDAAWARGTIPDPVKNVVASGRFEATTADRRIAEISAAYAERGLPFLWWRAPFHGPPDLGRRLERAGIWELGSSPGMAMDLADLGAPEPPPPGLEIRPVVDVEGLRHYLAVIDALPMPEAAPPAIRAQTIAAVLAHTGPRLALEPVPLRYVGWLDGQAVATSRLSLAGGAAGIYAVDTLPEVRGRGIGRAMTLAALHAGRGAGYRIATLQSSDIGYRIYRRIGFRDVFRYALHVGGVPAPSPRVGAGAGSAQSE